MSVLYKLKSVESSSSLIILTYFFLILPNIILLILGSIIAFTNVKSFDEFFIVLDWMLLLYNSIALPICLIKLGININNYKKKYFFFVQQIYCALVLGLGLGTRYLAWVLYNQEMFFNDPVLMATNVVQNVLSFGIIVIIGVIYQLILVYRLSRKSGIDKK